MSDTNPSPVPGALDIKVSSSTFRQKYRILNVKVQADKQLFELSDMLGKHGGLKPIHEYLAAEMEGAVQRFLNHAKGVIGEAVKVSSEIPSSK